MPRKLNIGNYHVELPQSRVMRVAMGVALILGGMIGFLPILGFWMIPLGLLVLSVDIPVLRRRRRLFQGWFERLRRVRPKWARGRESPSEGPDKGAGD